MVSTFSYFVILGAMRTGSNFLEDSLNGYTGLTSYGEVFNPEFVGQAHQKELFGRSPAQVAADPEGMISAMVAGTDGMPGFRLFRDHNQAALEHCLADRACAKIVLRRNPVDSFVSLKIVQQTNQWRLTDLKNRKSARIRFNPDEFAAYLVDLREFYGRCMTELQRSGQAPFHLSYEDLGDVDRINGAARFLGVEEQLEKLPGKTRKQNPGTLADKVENHDEMVATLTELDPLSLFDDASFEPTRGPVVPNYVAAGETGLLFMPINCGPSDSVCNWLGTVNGGKELDRGFTQKSLRQWKRQHKKHRSFVVIRHPVHRAFVAFQRHILSEGPQHYAEIRNILVQRYGLVLPPPGKAERYGKDELRAAFLSFLDFVKGNLAGQTVVRVDGAWASQGAILSGMTGFAHPDRVYREEELGPELEHLARSAGATVGEYKTDMETVPQLAEVYDKSVEAATRAAYQRDYMLFGFGPWAPPQAA